MTDRTTYEAPPRERPAGGHESPTGALGLGRKLLPTIREYVAYTLPLAALTFFVVAYQKLNVPRSYASTATIQIERPERVVVTQEVVETAVNSDVELNTYLQRFRSSELRERVMKSLAAEEISRLGQAAPATSSAGDIGTLQVASVARSLLIQITVTHRDPVAAAFIANRFVDQFIAAELEMLDRKNSYAVEYLKKRADELLQAASTAERALHDYMRSHDLVSLDSSTNVIAARLNVVSSALQQARLERLAAEEQLSLVEKQQSHRQNLLEIRAISSYGSVGDYARQLENLNREKEQLAGIYLRRHPKIVSLEKAIAIVATQLDSAITLAIADLRTSCKRARDTEKALQEEFALQEKAMFHLRDLAVDYKGLESRAQVAKSSYAAILGRLNEATTSKALGKVPIRQLDWAQPSKVPLTPNLTTIAANCAGWSMLVLLGTTLVISYFDDRIKTSRDIEDGLGEPLLAILTEVESSDERARYRLVVDRNSAGLIEPFMNLHAAVCLDRRHPGARGIMVTSTIPSEGKSFVAMNLAASFAYHGKRTLLIDCDIRRPVTHRALDLPDENGLLRWFESGATLDCDLLTHPELGILPVDTNLFALQAGGRSSHPTPLFESAAFAELIQRLKTHFDVLIIDTPPMGAVSDALYIAKAADEFIYVCRFNHASRVQVSQNLKTMRGTKSHFLGVVLNGIPRKRLAHYTNYKYYNSYQRYYK